MKQTDKVNHKNNYNSLYKNRYIEQISMEATLYRPGGVDGQGQKQAGQDVQEGPRPLGLHLSKKQSITRMLNYHDRDIR